jgi:hypothetical protein
MGCSVLCLLNLRANLMHISKSSVNVLFSVFNLQPELQTHKINYLLKIFTSESNRHFKIIWVNQPIYYPTEFFLSATSPFIPPEQSPTVCPTTVKGLFFIAWHYKNTMSPLAPHFLSHLKCLLFIYSLIYYQFIWYGFANSEELYFLCL